MSGAKSWNRISGCYHSSVSTHIVCSPLHQHDSPCLLATILHTYHYLIHRELRPVYAHTYLVSQGLGKYLIDCRFVPAAAEPSASSAALIRVSWTAQIDMQYSFHNSNLNYKFLWWSEHLRKKKVMYEQGYYRSGIRTKTVSFFTGTETSSRMHYRCTGPLWIP